MLKNKHKVSCRGLNVRWISLKLPPQKPPITSNNKQQATSNKQQATSNNKNLHSIELSALTPKSSTFQGAVVWILRHGMHLAPCRLY